MKILLARLLLIAGVCLGAVGGAGFGEPVEALAWPLFLVGVTAILAGGLLAHRERRRVAAEAAGGSAHEELAAALGELAGRVARLDDEREALAAKELCARLDELFAGPYFELGGRSEDYARALGPASFARIWEGFAVSERLLARAWSMAADDHLAEAVSELPRARAQLARAAEQASANPPG